MEEFKMPAYFFVAIVFYAIGHVVSYYKQRNVNKLLEDLKEYNTTMLESSLTFSRSTNVLSRSYHHRGVADHASKINKYFLKKFNENTSK